MNNDIFDVLRPLAEDIADRPWRHVAAVVLRNKIVAYGTSHKKSHPFQRKYSKNKEAIYWHAETNAIFNALKKDIDLSKAELYVCRIKRDNDGNSEFGHSKPCKGCYKCIRDFELANVYYT